jgi:hypothetical protein
VLFWGIWDLWILDNISVVVLLADVLAWGI